MNIVQIIMIFVLIHFPQIKKQPSQVLHRLFGNTYEFFSYIYFHNKYYSYKIQILLFLFLEICLADLISFNMSFSIICSFYCTKGLRLHLIIFSELNINFDLNQIFLNMVLSGTITISKKIQFPNVYIFI